MILKNEMEKLILIRKEILKNGFKNEMENLILIGKKNSEKKF